MTENPFPTPREAWLKAELDAARREIAYWRSRFEPPAMEPMWVGPNPVEVATNIEVTDMYRVAGIRLDMPEVSNSYRYRVLTWGRPPHSKTTWEAAYYLDEKFASGLSDMQLAETAVQMHGRLCRELYVEMADD